MIRSTLLETIPGVQCAVSTREDEPGGAAGNNLSPFEASLGVTDQRLAIPRQCHTANVRLVTGPGVYDETDALVTGETGLWLRVVVADCVPIFLVESRVRAVAAIHAGWRGISAGIVEKTMDLLGDRLGGDPGQMKAYLGPSAGVCCYEVGEEVARLFDEEEIARRQGRIFLDLKEANVRRLVRAGVPSGNIQISPFCTVCDPQRFHSYRRDRERAGRMIGIISISG